MATFASCGWVIVMRVAAGRNKANDKQEQRNAHTFLHCFHRCCGSCCLARFEFLCSVIHRLVECSLLSFSSSSSVSSSYRGSQIFLDRELAFSRTWIRPATVSASLIHAGWGRQLTSYVIQPLIHTLKHTSTNFLNQVRNLCVAIQGSHGRSVSS